MRKGTVTLARSVWLDYMLKDMREFAKKVKEIDSKIVSKAKTAEDENNKNNVLIRLFTHNFKKNLILRLQAKRDELERIMKDSNDRIMTYQNQPDNATITIPFNDYESLLNKTYHISRYWYVFSQVE